MPTLQQIRLTPLNPVLISGRTQLYIFKQFEGVAILRLDRTTFWVHDVANQVGVVVSGWDIAKKTLEELAQDF